MKIIIKKYYYMNTMCKEQLKLIAWRREEALGGCSNNCKSLNK